MSDMLEWARHEVELALDREKDCDDDSGFDYAKGCYESALKAFASLCEDGHSGMSISLTTGILNRLIKGQPLTPIEDNPGDWNELYDNSGDDVKHYQHKRLSSLFKDVYPDGTIKYNDVEAYECIDENSKIPYHGGGAGDIFYKYFPIRFPYNPPARRYRIVTREYLTDRKNGDFDTKMYVGIITPDGDSVSVNRYFGETDAGWEELNLSEFIDRIDAHYQRIEAERKEANQNGSV